MTAVQNHQHVDVLDEQDVVTHENARRALAVLRIGFGLTFLWAFFDKLLALGYATGKNAETGVVDRFGPDAWINEGNPTFGFLKFGVSEDNPFHGFFNSIAGDAWANWLFMLGLLGIGCRADLRHRDPVRGRDRGRRALPDDVGRVAPPGEQPRRG